VYSKLTHAKKWWHYYRTASNGVGHGIHSPFVFDFVKNVLNDKRDFYAFSAIESLRQQLKSDHTILQVDDLGAGSRVSATNQRKVSDIAKHALKSQKLAQFLFRLVNYYQPKTILELGTSLGITTAYLAAANGNARVYTIEGVPAIAELARKNFHRLNMYNTQLLEGSFDLVLPMLLEKINEVDLVFVDGNHRLEPTLRYFDWILKHSHEHTIFVFDDIHWSEEMELAWKKISAHPTVSCTIDLFFLGLVFFRKDFKEKQNFSIRY
jgi:predicted O-methyltransferase YrrM